MHVIFKLIAIILYMILNFIIGDQMFTFLFVLILCALDFWTVKNIIGRKLVGMKWGSKLN